MLKNKRQGVVTEGDIAGARWPAGLARFTSAVRLRETMLQKHKVRAPGEQYGKLTSVFYTPAHICIGTPAHMSFSTINIHPQSQIMKLKQGCLCHLCLLQVPS